MNDLTLSLAAGACHFPCQALSYPWAIYFYMSHIYLLVILLVNLSRQLTLECISFCFRYYKLLAFLPTLRNVNQYQQNSARDSDAEQKSEWHIVITVRSVDDSRRYERTEMVKVSWSVEMTQVRPTR
jgi:hypothetical protein